MDESRPQTSLAGIFVAITIFCGIFACARTEANWFVMPIGAAFLGGLLLPWGMRVGMTIAAVIIVINAYLLNPIVIPFMLRP